MDIYSSSSCAKDDAVARPSSSVLQVRRYFPTKFLTQQDVKGKLAFSQSVHHQNLDVATEAFYNANVDEMKLALSICLLMS